MALIHTYKGRSYDLSKSAILMTPEEHEVLAEELAAGECHRREIIRFGYLSEDERRRLIATYPDLNLRFEKEWTIRDYPAQAMWLFFTFTMGMAFGGATSVWSYIIGTIVYWLIALWFLRRLNKFEQDRIVDYWEWRGYKPDKYGRKIGEGLTR